MKKTGIALKLAELREEQKITQKELDELAGLPVGTVGQLESGKKPFSESRLLKLCRALNVSESVLLEAVHDKSVERKLVDSIVDQLTPLQLLEVALYLRRQYEDNSQTLGGHSSDTSEK